ncbi:hypothetical protein MPSEU_000608900 [Mayamaea pseudoterrestris]|nr:hypothetical protein MPSEU_000608900 [Mayamaea pseudoterrestris]
MAKPRVGVLLRETVAGSKSSNQSADLDSLKQKYLVFCKKVRHLIGALDKHQKAMTEMESSRSGVAASFALLAKETPMFDCIGLMPSSDRPSNTVCSYMSTHDVLSAKYKSYMQKYQQFVLEYAIEWEKVVTTRINNGLKKAEELRRELDHYQKKTEALRISVNQAMAKGKKVSSEQQEKLRRNEEKLMNSKQVYNRVATDLCILMEEVTQRSWRDLHPLLIKVAQFDMTLSSDESKVLSSLNQVVNELKTIATANGISPQPRLKDLANLKPELLSTRPGGVAGLAIEDDPNRPMNGAVFGISPTGSSSSFGANGMGSFPLPMSTPTSNDPYASALVDHSFMSPNSNASSFDPMASSSMATAMPPTLEDVYKATNHSANSIHSAPSSGNLPPMPSPMYGGGLPPRANSFNVNRSFDDNTSVVSGYSAYSAPAPMMAPPLPPMPPPPPPSSGNYGQSVSYGAAPSPSYAVAPSPASYGAPPLPQSQSGGFASAPSSSWDSYGQQQPQQNRAGNSNPFG